MNKTRRKNLQAIIDQLEGLKGSLEELAAYLDGEPQDGTRYVLACVQLDPVQKTVSYFVAQLYDGQKPLSAVSDILHGLGLNT